MTMRVWTYQTLDAAGEPLVAGTYYDFKMVDLATPMGDNFITQPLRDGRVLVIWDPRPRYEIKGELAIRSADVDLRSVVQYLAAWRYFGPNIYHHAKYHLPITLFHRGLNGTSPKAYVCYVRKAPDILVAQATEPDTARMHLARIQRPRLLKFVLEITLSGAWADFDDVTAVAWESRA